MIENSQYLNSEAINDLLEMIGDDTKEIMIEFQNSALDQLNSAREAVKSNDTETLINIIHSLKGAAGNIGLQKMFESCQRLEKDLRNNTETDIADCLENIQKEYFLTMAELKVLRLI